MIAWDAGGLIALLRMERGASAARRLVRAHHPENHIHSINLFEIYYGLERESGVVNAERALNLLTRLGIQVHEDMDTAFWKDAAHVKVTHHMSVADAFAIAMARRLNVSLVSTDHHELDAVHAAGTCRVLFVR